MPAVLVLLIVAGFWVISSAGALSLLSSPHTPPLETLTWLYLSLALICISSIALFLVLADITRRIRRNERNRQKLKR